MITLDSPVASVLGDKKGKRGKIIEGLGIETVRDLMRHFPRRYLETGQLTKVDDLTADQMLTVVGEIARSEVKTYRDRRTGRPAYRLETVLRTDGPSLKMTFFAKQKGVSEWQARRLSVGRKGVFIGKANQFRGEWQLTNPSMALFGIDDDEEVATVEALGDLYPLYPLTKGVEHWDIQRAVTFARTVLGDIQETLPDSVLQEYDVLDLRTSYDWIHAPDDFGQVRRAQRRFRFEEALVTQLVLGRRRRAVRAMGAVARSGGDGSLLAAFDERLPFELTAGQREVGAEIEHDLAQPHPMNRLLQGEVGSGKTIVALRAMLRTVDSGGQAALLAPTEVLAQQHYRSISALLGDLGAGGMLGGAAEGTNVVLLTGSMTKTQRKEPLLRIATARPAS